MDLPAHTQLYEPVADHPKTGSKLTVAAFTALVPTATMSDTVATVVCGDVTGTVRVKRAAKQANQARPSLAEMKKDVDIVRALCEYTFGKVIEELGRASPAEAPEIAARVGMGVLEKFRAFADVLTRLAEATGDDVFFRNVAEYVVASEKSPSLGFPGLDEDALAYWRCTARLSSMLTEHEVPPPILDDRNQLVVTRFVSLQQVLVLLGVERHDVSRDIQVAIASAYWSTFTSLVPAGHEEIIENAWALGQAEQSRASSDGDDCSWDDFERELLVG